MRISKRKTLKVDDLNQALKFYNFKVKLNFKNKRVYLDMIHSQIQNTKALILLQVCGDQSKM